MNRTVWPALYKSYIKLDGSESSGFWLNVTSKLCRAVTSGTCLQEFDLRLTVC